jgi:hypothetical protein
MIPDPIPQALPCHTAGSPNFDRLAGIYRWLEWLSFGPFLSRCRNAFLDGLGHRRRALILGDGDGRFTASLLRTNPGVRIEAIDSSPAMLSRLVRCAGSHADRVMTCCTDARAWKPSGSDYDLVVTHFFLDCMSTEEIGSLAARVRACVLPNAEWVVSEFAVPPGLYGKFVARPLVAFLYRAFGWLTGLQNRSLPDYRRALGQAGFRLTTQRPFLGGLLVAEAWSTDKSESPDRPRPGSISIDPGSATNDGISISYPRPRAYP